MAIGVFILVAFIPIVYEQMNLSYFEQQRKMAYLAVSTLAKEIDDIYFLGPGATRSIIVTLPDSVDFSHSFISGRTIFLRAAQQDFIATTRVDARGAWPDSSGAYLFVITAHNDFVSVAVQPVSFTPSSFSESVVSGGSADFNLLVENISERDVNYSIFIEHKSPWVDASLTSNQDDTFVLASGERISLSFTISCFKDAFGYYVASIIFDPLGTNDANMTVPVRIFCSSPQSKLVVSPSSKTIYVDLSGSVTDSVLVCNSSSSDFTSTRATISGEVSSFARTYFSGPLKANSCRELSIIVDAPSSEGVYSGLLRVDSSGLTVFADLNLEVGLSSRFLYFDWGGAKFDSSGQEIFDINVTNNGAAVIVDKIMPFYVNDEDDANLTSFVFNGVERLSPLTKVASGEWVDVTDFGINYLSRYPLRLGFDSSLNNNSEKLRIVFKMNSGNYYWSNIFDPLNEFRDFTVSNFGNSARGREPIYSVDENLVGLWRFNGNLDDSSVFGNNGSCSSCPGYSSGLWGEQGLDFNGEQVSISNLNVDQVDGGKNTVSFWMKWNGIPSQMPFSFSAEHNGLFIASGNCFGFSTGNNEVLGVVYPGLANEWVHVVAVFYNGVPSSSDSELWINGEKQSLYYCLGSSSNDRRASDSINVGDWNGGYYFSGEVDELAIWNRALQASEIEEIYSIGSGVRDFNVSSGGSGDTNLVGLWHLNDRNSDGLVLNSVTGVRDGWLVNGADTNAKGLWDSNAGYFDGFDDYGVVQNFDLSGTGVVSVSFWMKKEVYSNDNGISFELTNNFNDYSTGFAIIPGDSNNCVNYLGVFLKGNNGYNGACYQRPDNNLWHHFVAIFDKTRDNNEVDLYIDGVLIPPFSRPYNVDNNNTFGVAPIYFSSRAGMGYFSKSVIDEVSVWDRALTSEEVKTLYFQGISVNNFNLTSDAVGVWHLEDKNDSGWVLNSVTGNRDGVLKGRGDINSSGFLGSNAVDFRKQEENLLVNYRVWENGQTGSVAGFNHVGALSENFRVMGLDHRGRNVVVWEARSDSASDADGGWEGDAINVDNNKLYRFSVWVNRVINGFDGNFYLGVYGFTGSDNNGVLNLSDGTVNTDPYFWSSSGPPGSQLPEGQWVLVVGHVFPKDYNLTSNHVNSGRYDINGVKFGEIDADYKWSSTANKAVFRTYLYYCTDTSVRQRWVYPRIDIVDGNEPSISDLVNGFDNYGDDIELDASGGEKTFSLWYSKEPNGVWNHVVNSSGNYYFNGVKRDPDEYPIFIDSNKIYIGRDENSSFFKGLIDEVTIWDRVLTDGEVKAVYLDANRNRDLNFSLDSDGLHLSRLGGGFVSNGTFYSKVFDGNGLLSYDKLYWRSSLLGKGFESSTGSLFYARSSADGLYWGDWNGPFDSSPAYLFIQPGKFVQYKVVLSSSDKNLSPLVKDVNLTYFRGGS